MKVRLAAVNPSPRSERQATPRSEPRSEALAGDAVGVSPPIVRERSERQSFTGGQRSAPQIAPRMESGSAPRGGGAPATRSDGGAAR